jgi:hypothetical protein
MTISCFPRNLWLKLLIRVIRIIIFLLLSYLPASPRPTDARRPRPDPNAIIPRRPRIDKPCFFATFPSFATFVKKA